MPGIYHKKSGKRFFQDEHVMCHKDIVFNVIWSNLAIETYMIYGKGRSGIVGLNTDAKYSENVG